MMLRVAVIGMMLLGFTGFAAVGVLALREPPAAVVTVGAPVAPVAALAKRHTVLVAAAPLRAGVLLKPDDLAAKEVDDVVAGMQDDTAADRAALSGAMLRRSLGMNEPVLAADVMKPGERGFLAAVLSPGYRAATVAVDSVSGSAGMIWPGDHVDLILTQTIEDASLPTGSRVVAETVLSDVRVIAVDQLLARGVAPPAEQAGVARTVTLEVTSADAERIAVATRLGRLSLAVRAADEATASAARAPVTTTWARDVSPALGQPGAGRSDGATLRLYQGTADPKEIRF